MAQQKEVPLSQVLSTLQDRYKVSFSYADKTIQNIKSEIPDSSLNLNEALSFLNSQTSLHFIDLGNGQIVVQRGKNKSSTSEFFTQVLDEVLITNYLTKGIELSKHGNITFNPQEFGILPGLIEPDILQSIQALPGVISVDETVSNLNIRGGTHDQNLILWDGIKMYQPGHFFGLISAFNPYLIDKVNITKNGTSAQFTDGVSGTIDMKLDNEISEDFEAGLGFNSIYADGFFKAPISDKIELQLSARRSLTDFFETPAYNQYFERIFQDTDISNNQLNINQTVTKDEAFYFFDIGGKVLYNPTKRDKIRISFLTVNNNLDYLEQADINDSMEALESGLTQSNLAAGLEYHRTWSSRFESTIQLYGTKYSLEATNYDLVNDQRLIQKNEVLDLGFRLNTKLQINKNINWYNGYQLFEIGISNLQDVNNPEFRSFIKEVVRTHSLYSEVDFLSNNLTTNLRVGLRGNYFDKLSQFNLEPRISFSQRFLENFRLEILGELKSQTTSQIIDLQNDFLGIEKRRWILANNENRPLIESQQVSLGIHYNLNHWLISAEGYFKNIDGITTRGQGFQNQYQFVDATGNYQVVGIDFLINKQFDNISTWLGYSFSKNDYTFDSLNDGNRFPNNLDIRHSFSFAGTYTVNNFKFALGLNWRTGKPTTLLNDDSIVDGMPNFDIPNDGNLDDYFRADFSTTYNFKFSENTKAKIGFSIWNLLNQKQILNRYFTISNNQINSINKKSLGITPNVSFRVNF